MIPFSKGAEREWLSARFCCVHVFSWKKKKQCWTRRRHMLQILCNSVALVEGLNLLCIYAHWIFIFPMLLNFLDIIKKKKNYIYYLALQKQTSNLHCPTHKFFECFSFWTKTEPNAFIIVFLFSEMDGRWQDTKAS